MTDSPTSESGPTADKSPTAVRSDSDAIAHRSLVGSQENLKVNVSSKETGTRRDLAEVAVGELWRIGSGNRSRHLHGGASAGHCQTAACARQFTNSKDGQWLLPLPGGSTDGSRATRSSSIRTIGTPYDARIPFWAKTNRGPQRCGYAPCRQVASGIDRLKPYLGVL